MIKLPALFEQRLAERPQLASDVKKTLDLFTPWLEQSGMPFFPGFTDHSPRHINDVLNTASSLISDASHALLGPEDVAVLVVAILLHDCGMHLTQDGFRALIAQQSTPTVSGLGDRPWNQIWLEFLAEAQRFGEERLNAVFGDSEPIVIENLNINDLSERDCLLIGEFVRRHHARLAHEIALTGVPTETESRLRIVGLDPELLDLAGLVARSHGMSIRATFTYLESRYNRISEQRKTKTPYLMAVLRIADYVQVQSDRALKTLLSVKELRSPLSRQEWRNHFAVRDVSMRHEDPEAMYVHAAPADVKTYLRLASLFEDIQRELDDSWATLGEVYGRLGELGHLGLTIRRLRSNLENGVRFAATVPYIPINAGFKSSGPELLKLLQNAVDACKERSDLEEHGDGDVMVEIDEADDKTGWITVTDSGVGMTLETVTKYFLVAGASFRNSDLWKKQHTDDQGKPRILRGGRFGVGALAAFLLGDEMTVRTRHIDRSSAEGLEFTGRVDDPVIELRRCVAPAGTSIRIWVKDPAAMASLRPFKHRIPVNQLDGGIVAEWDAVDWFAQAKPEVSFRWSGNIDLYEHGGAETTKKVEIRFKPTNYLIPLDDADQSWRRLPTPSPYKRILWQYPRNIKKRHGDHEYEIRADRHVVVNGIRVQKMGSSEHDALEIGLTEEGKRPLIEGPPFSIERPSLAIDDPAGICPINLQRSAISFGRMGVDERLARDILEVFFLQLRASNLKNCTPQTYLEFCHSARAHPGVLFGSATIPPYCATKEGLLLATPRFLSAERIRIVYFAVAESMPDISLQDFLANDEALFIRLDSQLGEQAALGWFRSLYGGPSSWRSYYSGMPIFRREIEYGLVSKKSWSRASQRGKVARSIMDKLNTRPEGKYAVLLQQIGNGPTPIELGRLRTIHAAFGQESDVGAWRLTPHQSEDTQTSLLAETWQEVIGSHILSYGSKGQIKRQKKS
jgi:signal transduction histidine kinase